jgi:hypothetical protein
VTVGGDGIARAWVRAYTSGLPAETAQRRRDELASDLHEHTCAGGRSVEVLGRVLWGIPADLSWRRAARAPRLRRLETGEPMTLRKVTTALFAVYVLFNVWAAIGVLFNPDGETGPYGAALFTAAALMGLGIYWREDAPRRSTVLLCIGAVIPAFTLFWMAALFGPIALLLIGLAIATEPGRRTAAPAV